MKRILSIILACAMIVGIMPMSFAAGDGDYNEYIFTAASHGLEADKTTFISMTTADCSLDATVVGDKWAYVNDLSANKRDLGYEYIRLRHLVSTSDQNARPEAFDAVDNTKLSSGLILELVVDVAGDVVPSITYKTSSSGMRNDVYLVEKSSITNPAGWTSTTSRTRRQAVFNHVVAHPEQRLGMIDAYGESVEIKTASFRRYDVQPGNYYLVILPNGASDGWTTEYLDSRYVGSLDLKSFMLSETPDAKEAYYNYDISTNALSSTAITDFGSLQESTNATSSGVIDNLEHQYISWKSKLDKNPALDANKTDGFELYGRSGYDNALVLEDIGVHTQFNIGKGTSATEWTAKNYEGTTIATRPQYMLKLNIPYAGEYELSVVNRFTADSDTIMSLKKTSTQANGADASVFDEGVKVKTYFGKANGFNFTYKSTGTVNNLAAFAEVYKNYEYLGIYDSNVLATDAETPAKTMLGTVTATEPGEYILVFDMSSLENEKCWFVSRNSVFRQLFLLSGVELKLVEDTEQEKVQAEYDSITNVNPGNATEKAPASTTSNVKILCGADNSVLDTDDVAAGSDITYTAPEKEGYTFLYWAQGMGEFKKIASYDAKLSVKAEKGPMWLTAVYADNNSAETDVIFYNANGDEISRSQYNENDAIMLPALPSLAGFDTATGWTLDADGETYTADDEVRASGKLMRFVAEYSDEPSESFEITVIGGTADNATPAYGETVTVTAPARKNNTGMQLFNYWERDGEIVSFDLSYSFKAWKDTTVTAVYNDYTPVAKTVRKIILGTRLVGGETAAVAEFIGISDVVEKGILFGTDIDNATHKISMKTEGDTFSVIDDVSGEAIGYAILSNGNVIYSK